MTSHSVAALHVAIIMDGNGRWAERTGRARLAGHRAGADTVRRVVEAAPSLGIGTLTLYAFSSDNWSRPAAEVSALMRLLRVYMRTEAGRCASNGVRLCLIGRRDRLPPSLLAETARAEAVTARGSTLHLRLAVDYSSRDAILRAASALRGARTASRETFARLIGQASPGGCGGPDVDLLIRTGGERRLSDFLLWECAYAELHFTPVMWPDFCASDLESAIADFHSRDRRFGRVHSAVGAAKK